MDGEPENVDVVPEYQEILEAAANSPRKFAVPRKVSRKNLEQAFLTSFELIGGVPRLAMWADQNPGAFYALSTKLFPQQSKVEHNVGPSLAAVLTQMGRPTRSQDRPTLDVSDAEVVGSSSPVPLPREVRA